MSTKGLFRWCRSPYLLVAFAAVLTCGLLLTGCTKPPAADEIAVTKFFALLKKAEAYDRVCHDPPRLSRDRALQSNIFWAGNSQVITERMTTAMIARDPALKAADGAKRLADIGQTLQDEAERVLRQGGCQSDEAQAMGAAFDIVITEPPLSTLAAINDEMAKARTGAANSR